MRSPLRLIRLLLLALVIPCWLVACGKAALQEQQAFVFGTRVEVIVVDPDPEQGRRAIAAVLREFDRLHRNYHAWQPSELSTVNSAFAAGRPQQVSPELAEFMREAQSLSAQGNYLFDPGIGALIKLWGFHADEFVARLPDPNVLAEWSQGSPSIADLHIDGTTVTSQQPRLALDFGGYLKGVALDRAAAILRTQGIHHALINIGGNVMALGNKEGSKDGRKWRVGIQHPRQPGPLATVQLADGEAIGTSGDYQRYFEVDGKRYAHLIDPRSAYPVTHTQAVTVLLPPGAKAGTLSDAASKPIFIAGPAGWQDMAQKMQINMVLRVDRDNRIFVTQALHQRLNYLGEMPEINVVP